MPRARQPRCGRPPPSSNRARRRRGRRGRREARARDCAAARERARRDARFVPGSDDTLIAFSDASGDRVCYEAFQSSLRKLGDDDKAFSECGATGFYSCVEDVETAVSS